MQISREGVTRPPLYFVVWDTGYQFLLHGAVASYVTTTVFKPSDVLKFGATNKKNQHPNQYTWFRFCSVNI